MSLVYLHIQKSSAIVIEKRNVSIYQLGTLDKKPNVYDWFQINIFEEKSYKSKALRLCDIFSDTTAEYGKIIEVREVLENGKEIPITENIIQIVRTR